MANRGNRVLLGFEDEPITDKYRDQVNFTTNKIGGKPDWPGDSPTAVNCKLCGLNLPLVLQIYAPLDYSPYHRTLYIFACINPNCWNQKGSWVCLRSQVLDPKSTNNAASKTSSLLDVEDWSIGGGDDWGGGEDEENGNLITLTGRGDLRGQEEPPRQFHQHYQAPGEDLARGLSEMEISTADERNANSSAEEATGQVPMATATIEGDEGEEVCIDSPLRPGVNLLAVLEETCPLPQVPVSRLEFSPHFLSVWEEELCLAPPPSPTQAELALGAAGAGGGGGAGRGEELATPGGGEELYEKSLPAHGDKMFHQFITKIQANPGQILRYGGYPLALYPLTGRPKSCSSCGGELRFELQVLPTLVAKLRLSVASEGTHLEFGSVFLFSCRSSCWSEQDIFREEELIVQAERL